MANPKRASLRAVKDGEQVAAPKPITSVLEAAENGTVLDELEQMRRVASRRIDDPNTNPTALAALMRRQIEISREIETLKRQKSEEAESIGATEDSEWSEEAI